MVWLGRDDNKPTGLSGASGALRVWMDLMAGLKLEPLDAPPPADVEEIRVEPRSGLRVGEGCRRGEPVPFLVGSEPRGSILCAPPAPHRPKPRSPDTDGADDADGMNGFFQRLMD